MFREYLKDKWAQIVADLQKAHKSATIFFNAVIGTSLVFLPDAVASFPQLQPYIPDAVFKHGMVILIAGNMLLRFKTTRAMRDK